jgi:hypothetical protein
VVELCAAAATASHFGVPLQEFLRSYFRRPPFFSGSQ